MNSEENQHAGAGEIWLEREEQDLLDVNDTSIFYTDFPPLPDFPCMSSSSSSSSARALAKPISSSSSSSSSAASWAVLKSDDTDELYAEKNTRGKAPALSSTASMLPENENFGGGSGDMDCMDVMETFGYMELIDSNEIWDPSSIFQTDNVPESQQPQQPQPQDDPPDIGRPADELGVFFFEWLKSNREYISAEDMRSIKLRRATVECASKRLGSTKEGRKQLLKLILEWVEQYQLQKKRLGEAAAAADPRFPCQYQEPFQNPNPNPNFNPITPNVNNTCVMPSTWMHQPPSQPPYAATADMLIPVPTRYGGGDPYTPVPNYPPASNEYHMLDPVQTWPPSQYGMAAGYNQFPANHDVNGNNTVSMTARMPVSFGRYGGGGGGGQYQYNHQSYQGGGEKLVRLGSSATKEARKKRMARQRRFLSHHRHQNHQHQNNLQNQNQNADHQQVSVGGESCGNAGQGNMGNWVYLPNADVPAPPSTVAVAAADASPQQNVVADQPPVQGQSSQQRQVSSEKRQGWKPEKNLKFLLQKVLKQSDVGNLGRIVLPKKEAETHLPELEARDGIPIAMEDIGTSLVWNMRYRFWPNNKSRMYLLENTGDFVRANGLQEGDFIVIYSDIKCGKYLIRGVKVRQPGQKPEAKKTSKSPRNMRTASPAGGSASSPQPSQKQ